MPQDALGMGSLPQFDENDTVKSSELRVIRIALGSPAEHQLRFMPAALTHIEHSQIGQRRYLFRLMLQYPLKVCLGAGRILGACLFEEALGQRMLPALIEYGAQLHQSDTIVGIQLNCQPELLFGSSQVVLARQQRSILTVGASILGVQGQRPAEQLARFVRLLMVHVDDGKCQQHGRIVGVELTGPPELGSCGFVFTLAHQEDAKVIMGGYAVGTELYGPLV